MASRFSDAHLPEESNGVTIHWDTLGPSRTNLTLPQIARYGVEPSHDNWTYHPDLIPRFNPYYTQAGERTFVNDDNATWQQEALAGLTQWFNGGGSSITLGHLMYKTVDRQKTALLRV